METRKNLQRKCDLLCEAVEKIKIRSDNLRSLNARIEIRGFVLYAQTLLQEISVLTRRDDL